MRKAACSAFGCKPFDTGLCSAAAELVMAAVSKRLIFARRRSSARIHACLGPHVGPEQHRAAVPSFMCEPANVSPSKRTLPSLIEAICCGLTTPTAGAAGAGASPAKAIVLDVSDVS